MKAHTIDRGLEALRRAGVSSPLLSAQEEVALARRARQGDRAATDKLVRSHLRLAFALASQYTRFGVTFEDLIGEATLGLMEAVSRFDPSRGARLASYASLWIRAFLRRYTLNNRAVVRPPATRSSRRVIAHLSATRRALTQRDGREPDTATLAHALDVEPVVVETVRTALRARDVPCDVPRELGGHEPACHAPSPEVQVAEREQSAHNRAAIDRALDRLPARERIIIAQRELEPTPRKLEEIGNDLGLSRERVRQLQQGALAKLRVELGGFAYA